jgi:hypothetical protein
MDLSIQKLLGVYLCARDVAVKRHAYMPLFIHVSSSLDLSTSIYNYCLVGRENPSIHFSYI